MILQNITLLSIIDEDFSQARFLRTRFLSGYILQKLQNNGTTVQESRLGLKKSLIVAMHPLIKNCPLLNLKLCYTLTA